MTGPWQVQYQVDMSFCLLSVHDSPGPIHISLVVFMPYTIIWQSLLCDCEYDTCKVSFVVKSKSCFNERQPIFMFVHVFHMFLNNSTATQFTSWISIWKSDPYAGWKCLLSIALQMRFVLSFGEMSKVYESFGKAIKRVFQAVSPQRCCKRQKRHFHRGWG